MNYYFDCYHHYYGNCTCYKHSGELCKKKCKDFITIDDYLKTNETDLRISIAHLREILSKIADGNMIYNIKVDELIKQIKQEL